MTSTLKQKLKYILGQCQKQNTQNFKPKVPPEVGKTDGDQLFLK